MLYFRLKTKVAIHRTFMFIDSQRQTIDTRTKPWNIQVYSRTEIKGWEKTDISFFLFSTKFDLIYAIELHIRGVHFFMSMNKTSSSFRKVYINNMLFAVFNNIMHNYFIILSENVLIQYRHIL